jgi:TonB family protein
MSEDFLHSSPFSERRKAARVSLKSVIYVELEPGNGGLILNLSDDGLAVQAAEPIVGAAFPHLRFCLPDSTKWIEAEGKLVWEGASRKEAGIQFIRISTEARAQIRTWLNGANASSGLGGDAGSPDVAEREPHSPELVQEEVNLSEDLDSMFPSEKQVSSARAAAVHRSPDFFPSEADAQAPFSRNRAPLEPAVGTLESDIPAQAQGRPNQSDLHSYRASTRPRSGVGPGVGPAVGVDQAEVGSSRTQPHPESNSNERGSGMPVPNFRHPPPNPSPNPSIDPNGDRATHERLVAAFAAAANSSSTHSGTPPQARVSNKSVHRPSDHPPIAFSGFGYQPSEFEEPFGKKWIGVAAVLMAIVAIGVVLAVGPANVKSLIVQRYAIFESLAGPPPPSEPEKRTERQDAAANVATPEKAEKPQEPATSPAAVPSDARDVQNSQSAADPAPDADPPAPDSAKDSGNVYGGGDIADPEAEVLKFQREHSQTHFTGAYGYHPPTDGSVPYPKSDVPASPVPPAASTADPRRDPAIGDVRGNSQVSRSASETERALSEPPRSTPQTQQPRDGVVAIRSSFNAVRGIDTDPSEPASNDGPLVPGQLRTMHQPNYPAEALRAHVEGTVTLRATVDRAGTVQAVQLIGGPPILAPAAIEAVRQWRYAPTTLNGQAVECMEDISVVFRLANSVAAPH